MAHCTIRVAVVNTELQIIRIFKINMNLVLQP